MISDKFLLFKYVVCSENGKNLKRVNFLEDLITWSRVVALDRFEVVVQEYKFSTKTSTQTNENNLRNWPSIQW